MATEERQYESELNQERLSPKKNKVEAKTKRPGALKKLWKNPFAKLSIFSLGELIPFLGILPFQIGFVFSTWREEKKSGKSPNIAEYMVIGTIASAVDIIGALFELTGAGVILGKAIAFPGLCLLFLWRLNKHGLHSTMSSKKIKVRA